MERPYGTVFVPGVGETAWGLELSWRRLGPGRTFGGEWASAKSQRPRGCALAAILVAGFVVVCCFLGFFVLHRAPYGRFSGVGFSRLASGMFWIEGKELAVEGL